MAVAATAGVKAGGLSTAWGGACELPGWAYKHRNSQSAAWTWTTKHMPTNKHSVKKNTIKLILKRDTEQTHFKNMFLHLQG